MLRNQLRDTLENYRKMINTFVENNIEHKTKCIVLNLVILMINEKKYNAFLFNNFRGVELQSDNSI